MKTASVKSSADIRAELESANISGQQIELIAGEILNMIEKKAEDAAVPPVENVAAEPATDPAAAEVSADPALASAALASDEQLHDDAEGAAIAAAKASINDAASAISTLESIESAEAPVPEAAAAEAAAAEAAAATEVPAAETADAASADTQVVASDKASGQIEKKAEEEKSDEKKEEDKEEPKKEEEKEEETDEDKEVEAALAEFDRILKEGSEEEKEEIIKLAYDQAIVKMANDGITLRQYILSRVGDEVLADTVTEYSEKLAALSHQNYLKVADDILYQMEKTASEL